MRDGQRLCRGFKMRERAEPAVVLSVVGVSAVTGGVEIAEPEAVYAAVEVSAFEPAEVDPRPDDVEPPAPVAPLDALD